MKRTKIVATIGPASESQNKIEQMVKAGLNVARLNFSHGTYEHHAMLVKNIRTVSKKRNRPIAIIQDLQGPKIRIGDIDKQGVVVTRGQKIFLTANTASFKTNKAIIPIQYANLYKDVARGHVILVDDGTIELKVLGVKNKMIYCKVVVPGLIFSHKGMNLPNSRITTSPITAKDKKDIVFGVKQGVDYIALSFVQNAKDIINLRKLIDAQSGGGKIKIIAKIERPLAVENFDEILGVADGIMVARGDLGLELPMANVPRIQKEIVRKCIVAAKPVIVATQMLDSMIRNPLPTRAEVSDVANAIVDGADAIMLSGETATGKYPLKAVQVMNKVAQASEDLEIQQHELLEVELKGKPSEKISDSLAYAAQEIAEEVKAKTIVAVVENSETIQKISKFRSGVPIFALSASIEVLQQLALIWGVESVGTPSQNNITQLSAGEFKNLLSKQLKLKKGDRVVALNSTASGVTAGIAVIEL